MQRDAVQHNMSHRRVYVYQHNRTDTIALVLIERILAFYMLLYTIAWQIKHQEEIVPL